MQRNEMIAKIYNLLENNVEVPNYDLAMLILEMIEKEIRSELKNE
jgi:hypothetical protein